LLETSKAGFGGLFRKLDDGNNYSGDFNNIQGSSGNGEEARATGANG